jgi:phosphoribosylformylglycinamidine synthase
VAEAWRNLIAVGAKPLAVTDNLNFGNPEKPEVMGLFAGAIRGMAAACDALDFPVVSGNVSFYNETAGSPILPTPSIGGLGVIEDLSKVIGMALSPWLHVVLIGNTRGWLGQSLWLREIAGRQDGAPPAVDLSAERAHGEFVRSQIQAGLVRACHDVSDGGILVALAEMALAGNVGLRVFSRTADIPGHAFWFGEDQGRYLLAVTDAGAVIRAAEAVGIQAVHIASSGGKELTLPDGGTISIAALCALNERFLPMLMSQP